MLLNNLKLTLRRFGRQKLNTSLHVVGLTLGITVCLLIGLFLRHEMSFDNYHDKADRIYRINSVWTNGGKINYHYSTPLPLAKALRTEVSGLEKITLAHPQGDKTILEINSGKRLVQDHILIVEPSFLEIFKVDVVKGGSGKDILAKPYQALLTETTAQKFYGKEDPIGKTFLFKGEFTMTVAGIIKDLPSNTHLPASMLLSYVEEEDYLGVNLESAWTSVYGTMTYAVLPKNSNPKNIELQLKTIADKYVNANPARPAQMRSDFDVQPLSDIHFNTQYGSVWVSAVNTQWLWFFGIIGLCVLFLAVINFINLSTAQAMTRAKEIGVRKTIGAGRFHLISSFLFEAMLITLFAGVLSLVIADFSTPLLNHLLDKNIPFDFFQTPSLWLAFIGGLILTALLSGMYPAWVITKFQPVSTLKAGKAGGSDPKAVWLRKGLVVTQFTIAVGLLIMVALMTQQVSFLRDKDLGFDKENTLNVYSRQSDKDALMSSELRQIPQIKSFSFATAPPSSTSHKGTRVAKSQEDGSSATNVSVVYADEQYSKLYSLKLLSGRFMQAADTNAYSKTPLEENTLITAVVNEKLLETLSLGTPEEALGKRFWASLNSGYIEIIGVVANFDAGTLHKALKPVVITQAPNQYRQVGIKIEKGADIPQALTAIEKAWKTTYPDGFFEFTFLDEQIDAYYKADVRLYNLFKVFAGLAMLISCLGLWGLASFAAQQRTKEIGIRKVLGASVAGIAALLSKEFLTLVGLAFLVASPIAYFLAHKWLQDFAYRISISWWVFVVVGFVVGLIALLTVSFQAVKAAVANPVKSLRTE
jgi:putative ABC transport system permease protein